MDKHDILSEEVSSDENRGRKARSGDDSEGPSGAAWDPAWNDKGVEVNGRAATHREPFPGRARTVCAVGLVALLSVISSPQSPVTAPKTQESIVPLPFTVDQDPAKAALGERLFHDVRLSRDNSMSCATCH